MLRFFLRVGPKTHLSSWATRAFNCISLESLKLKSAIPTVTNKLIFSNSGFSFSTWSLQFIISKSVFMVILDSLLVLYYIRSILWELFRGYLIEILKKKHEDKNSVFSFAYFYWFILWYFLWYMQLLSHGDECNMGNIFRVSHILQLLSLAFRQVK